MFRVKGFRVPMFFGFSFFLKFLGFKVLELMVFGLRCRVLGLRVPGLGSRVQGVSRV